MCSGLYVRNLNGWRNLESFVMVVLMKRGSVKSVRCVFLESGARSLASWQQLCTCARVFFSAEASLAEALPRDVPLLANYPSAHMCLTPGAKMAPHPTPQFGSSTSRGLSIIRWGLKTTPWIPREPEEKSRPDQDLWFVWTLALPKALISWSHGCWTAKLSDWTELWDSSSTSMRVFATRGLNASDTVWSRSDFCESVDSDIIITVLNSSRVLLCYCKHFKVEMCTVWIQDTKGERKEKQKI